MKNVNFNIKIQSQIKNYKQFKYCRNDKMAEKKTMTFYFNKMKKIK